MKLIATATFVTALALAAPAQAQFFNSGNSGLLGLGNNLLNLQTGNISVLDGGVLNGGILNGGILNGANVLSGIGLNSSARTQNSATTTTVTGHGNGVAPGYGGTVVQGRNNTVVPGSNNTVVPGHGNVVGTGNVVGAGNSVGNSWSSQFHSRTYNSFW